MQSLTASELVDKALAFWKNGRYTDPDKVLEYLNKAISLDPNYAEAYNGIKGDGEKAAAPYVG
jgi:hypothetical protein